MDSRRRRLGLPGDLLSFAGVVHLIILIHRMILFEAILMVIPHLRYLARRQVANARCAALRVGLWLVIARWYRHPETLIKGDESQDGKRVFWQGISSLKGCDHPKWLTEQGFSRRLGSLRAFGFISHSPFGLLRN